MELDVQRHERIMAPLQLWEEIDSLDSILAKTPQISEFDIVPGGQKARGKARLAWGPVKWTSDLAMEITDIQPPHRIAFSIDAPALEVHMDAVMELTPVFDNGTTKAPEEAASVHHGLISSAADCGHRCWLRTTAGVLVVPVEGGRGSVGQAAMGVSSAGLVTAACSSRT